jgi:peroxiredoxin
VARAFPDEHPSSILMYVATLAFLIMLQGLTLVSLWTILYQAVRQQGRLLLRLDDLDRRLSHAGIGATPEEHGGHPVGTPLPSFGVPDLDGRMVSADDLRGRRSLLVFWSPACGFCELIAADLAGLQADLSARGVQLVLVSREGAGQNRALAEEFDLTCPILLPPDDSPLVREVFLHQGTPTAYLLDAAGRVARPLAVGGDEILALARGALADRPQRVPLPGERPLSESRIERDGLKAGAPAPAFRLPDLNGGTVALEDYRGRRVLLVFSDPHCGPCEELAPHLVRLHRRQRDGGLAVLMVTRGDVEENRRKAETYGFEFPVALQERWKLSREYGIFAMPVAFLIDEAGVIAKNVARGVAEILALVPRETAVAQP